MNVHDHIDNEILLFAALYNILKDFLFFFGFSLFIDYFLLIKESPN